MFLSHHSKVFHNITQFTIIILFKNVDLLTLFLYEKVTPRTTDIYSLLENKEEKISYCIDIQTFVYITKYCFFSK